MEILKEYLPLCWLKSHPLQLSSSKLFFQQNLVFFFVTEFLTQANMIPVMEAFVEVIMNTGLTLLFVFVILSLNRSMHSYLQIATAVLFCENVVVIFAVPVIAWLTVTHSWLSYTLLAVLLFWDFAIITYIMKKVLVIDNLAGSIVTFLYFTFTYAAAYSFTLAF